MAGAVARGQTAARTRAVAGRQRRLAEHRGIGGQGRPADLLDTDAAVRARAGRLDTGVGRVGDAAAQGGIEVIADDAQDGLHAGGALDDLPAAGAVARAPAGGARHRLAVGADVAGAGPPGAPAPSLVPPRWGAGARRGALLRSETAR